MKNLQDGKISIISAYTPDQFVGEIKPTKTIEPNNPPGEPLISGFEDRALINVNESTVSSDAAFIFEFENGEIGYGLFTNGGHKVAKPGSSSSGAGGVSHSAIEDVLEVYINQGYNSLLTDVIKYVVVDIDTFKSISGVANPRCKWFFDTSLKDLSWSSLLGLSPLGGSDDEIESLSTGGIYSKISSNGEFVTYQLSDGEHVIVLQHITTLTALCQITCL